MLLLPVMGTSILMNPLIHKADDSWVSNLFPLTKPCYDSIYVRHADLSKANKCIAFSIQNFLT